MRLRDYVCSGVLMMNVIHLTNASHSLSTFTMATTQANKCLSVSPRQQQRPYISSLSPIRHARTLAIGMPSGDIISRMTFDPTLANQTASTMTNRNIYKHTSVYSLYNT